MKYIKAFQIMERMDLESFGYEIDAEEYEEFDVELPDPRMRKRKSDKSEFLAKIALKQEQLKYWRDVIEKEPDNKKAAAEIRGLEGYLRKHGNRKGVPKKKDSHRVGKKVATGSRDKVLRRRRDIYVAEPVDPIVYAE